MNSGFMFMVFVCVTCFTLYTSYTVSQIQGEPYMDEIFHIPQLQNFCTYNFEWDPKITTPPGLYLTSIALLWPLSLVIPSFGNLDAACNDIFAVRLVNVFFHILTILVIYKILVDLELRNDYCCDEKASQARTFAHSLNIVLLPVLYFFSFLYYTDPGAVFFTLVAYLFCLRGRTMLSAFFMAWSVMFRQTNIIWVPFFFAYQFTNILKLYAAKRLESHDVRTEYYRDSVSILIDIITARRPGFFLSLWHIGLLLIKAVWPYICVVLGFLCFVVWNGGLALGDRSAHVAAFHVPQLFYFLAFTCALAGPHLLTVSMVKQVYNLSLGNFRRICLLILLTASFIASVRFFTYEHLYLISDNRHYTFYLWMRLFRPFWFVKYILVLPYVFAFYVMASALSNACRDRLLTLAFFICTAANLLPQALLEFRYYLVPFIIFRVNIAKVCNSPFRLLIEFALFASVNLVTLYLFINKPFIWPHDPLNTQRFMW